MSTEERASGADRTRPVLARLLRDIGPGETLVVVRLDRLARSVSHLLAVIAMGALIGVVASHTAIRLLGSAPPRAPTPGATGH